MKRGVADGLIPLNVFFLNTTNTCQLSSALRQLWWTKRLLVYYEHLCRRHVNGHLSLVALLVLRLNRAPHTRCPSQSERATRRREPRYESRGEGRTAIAK